MNILAYRAVWWLRWAFLHWCLLTCWLLLVENVPVPLPLLGQLDSLLTFMLLQLFVGLQSYAYLLELSSFEVLNIVDEPQVAVVSIWEPSPPLRAAACCFAQTKHCCRRSTKCLASEPSVSRLTRPIKRLLSRYSSLMIVMHSNINRFYQAISALHQDGRSKHFMSVGFGRMVLGMVLVMSISAASYTAPSCKCSTVVETCSFSLCSYVSALFLCLLLLTPMCNLLLGKSKHRHLQRKTCFSWRLGAQLIEHTTTNHSTGKVGLDTVKMPFAMNRWIQGKRHVWFWILPFLFLTRTRILLFIRH